MAMRRKLGAPPADARLAATSGLAGRLEAMVEV
jgi:hypothetical protein